MRKRARGRPTVNDDALLQAVAAKLARKQAPSPRSAIVQVLPTKSNNQFDSDVRRLQRKWRQRGTALLVEAEAMLKRQEQERAELKRMADRIAGDHFGLSPALAELTARQALVEQAVRPFGDAMTHIRQMEAEWSRQMSGIGKAFEQMNLVTNAAWAQFNDPAERIRRELREIELLTRFGRSGGI